MGTEQAAPSDSGRSKRGLASASEETRKQVARKGGVAPHQKRGLAAANEETRARVAKAGGEARANDREGLREAGKRGGEPVRERYGIDFYREIGEKGGGTVKERYGTGFYSEIGKRGGDIVKQERGSEYYSTIGKKGGEARTAANVNVNTVSPEEQTTMTESAGGTAATAPKEVSTA
jgi:general stress protein YciG